jgi:hypothetical protein
VSDRRGLTRQEALWWVAPTLRHWRERLVEGKGVLGRSLPVLLFANELGWYVRGSYTLMSAPHMCYRHTTRSGSINSVEGGPWSSLIWTTVHEALGHPKPLVLENLRGDAERCWRFVNTAYDRFMAPEPEVASLWEENGQLLCGWDPLPPEDGRLPCRDVPGNLPVSWFGDVEWVHVDEWTWRVDRTDLRYDGMHANDPAPSPSSST